MPPWILACLHRCSKRWTFKPVNLFRYAVLHKMKSLPFMCKYSKGILAWTFKSLDYLPFSPKSRIKAKKVPSHMSPAAPMSGSEVLSQRCCWHFTRSWLSRSSLLYHCEAGTLKKNRLKKVLLKSRSVKGKRNQLTTWVARQVLRSLGIWSRGLWCWAMTAGWSEIRWSLNDSEQLWLL